MFYLDPLYLVILFATLIISIGTQFYISSTYKKYSQIRNSMGLTGPQVGKLIVERTRLGDRPPAIEHGGRGTVFVEGIGFERTPGQLTDHYDPRTHTVRLSDGVATTPSVASMAIVAHELGHAEQHEQGSVLIAARNFLVPAVTISPRISYILILIGLLFNLTGLFWLGVIFFGVAVVFALLTLPVEIDASRRGLRLLTESGVMQTEQDASGARSVLTAAASTYVAAAVTALLQLLYYISIGRRRG